MSKLPSPTVTQRQLLEQFARLKAEAIVEAVETAIGVNT